MVVSVQFAIFAEEKLCSRDFQTRSFLATRWTRSIHVDFSMRYRSNRIFSRVFDSLEELLRALGVIREDVVGHHAPGRLTHPLEKRKVLELVGLEDLEHLDRFVVAEVLDEVAHVARDHAHVARDVVEGPGGAVGGENRDARAALDEKRPFVRVGVPVHFAHRARADVEVSRGDGLADGEVGRVGDSDQPACRVERFLVEHLVRELEFGFLDVGASRFFVFDRPRKGALEDVFLGLGDRVEHFG